MSGLAASGGMILTPAHPDDVHLHGLVVSQAEQADDDIIMSTSFPPFQAKVSQFFRWFGNKRVFISARKSKWMIFGPYPSYPITAAWRHRGGTGHRAPKARNASNAAFSMKHRIGSLPIKEGLILYMARIDCYLISGADIYLDVDAAHAEELIDAQHLFLQRLLGINSRSMLAVLFTETGLMPIKIRRLLLALGRLCYMINLGDDSVRVVRSALLDSLDMFRMGYAGWAGDIAIILSSLPTPIRMTPADLSCLETVKAIMAKVAEKTHLLRNRLESIDDTFRLVTRRRRHYLMLVPTASHRKALTRLLLGDHSLSVERLRYPSRYRLAIPRDARLCRFCCKSVMHWVWIAAWIRGSIT
ncbi:hypothetical protein B0H15DRAFT_939909 [Mycena belliarum]|uniref:Reverse transcriptase domain-containing protein n=1 Tax=Mycena belliarum TaxID=1033014 RepID=A0AAD6XPV9_9AGAR|nr:hypothetical protein B0H15DRAFT_939909 [Mycena belliae]